MRSYTFILGLIAVVIAGPLPESLNNLENTILGSDTAFGSIATRPWATSQHHQKPAAKDDDLTSYTASLGLTKIEEQLAKYIHQREAATISSRLFQNRGMNSSFVELSTLLKTVLRRPLPMHSRTS